MTTLLHPGQRPDANLVSGVPLAVMVACYAPILLWGPLELLATVGYWLRRRRPARAQVSRTPVQSGDPGPQRNPGFVAAGGNCSPARHARAVQEGR